MLWRCQARATCHCLLWCFPANESNYLGTPLPTTYPPSVRWRLIDSGARRYLKPEEGAFPVLNAIAPCLSWIMHLLHPALLLEG